jgi:short-subunit dehydrogenase
MNYYQDRSLVTGVSDGICSELVKQLSDSGAIFMPGIHSNENTKRLTKLSSGGDTLMK